jgi:hypothetical protein
MLQQKNMTNSAYSALFCHLIHTVQSFVVVVKIIINNHCYKSYLPFGVASYWLFRNNAQKAWNMRKGVGEWQIHAQLQLLCWKICAPQLYSLGVPAIVTYSSSIIWLHVCKDMDSNLCLFGNSWSMDVILGSAGNFYVIYPQKFDFILVQK